MRLLVVEDEPRMAGLLRQGLSEEGHSVTLAAEGRHGFDLASSGEFDVLILDVMLPGISGFEIARRLREVQSGDVKTIPWRESREPRDLRTD